MAENHLTICLHSLRIELNYYPGFFSHSSRESYTGQTHHIMSADINGDEFNIKRLIEHIRSDDEADRRITISQIPSLVLKSLKSNDKIIDQLLLVIYNLNTTDTENYEYLNAGNSTLIIRHLLRLYVDTIDEHQQRQINSMIGLIDFVHSSDLLVELAYALYRCGQSLEDGDTESIDRALRAIEDKATVGIHHEALLMINSIKAMRSR